MGKLLNPLGKISMNLANFEFSFLTSSIQKVARKECFGEMSLYLKFLAAIKEPMGDVMAMSRVSSYSFGTYKIVSPFFTLRAACTPR